MRATLQGRISRIVLAAVCAGVLCGVPALAQDAAPSGPPPGGRGPGMGAHELEMLTKRLSLTTDQQAQVKSILDDSQKQMETLRDDTSTSREEKRPKMMEIRKASEDKIRATLTDDQKTKYDQMLAEMRERMKQHGDGPPPSQQ